MNRRAFFERSGRWVSGTVLGLLAGILLLKREVTPPANCGEEGVCRGCLQNQRCVRPAANKWRKMMDNET